MSSYIPRSLLDQARPEAVDPAYRMSMLPFGTYPNADGSGEHLGFAVPGMVQEPMNALMNLIGTPLHPGTFASGPDYGSNAEDMRTLLETFLGGNATRGMGAGEVAARALSDTTPSLPGAVIAGAERNTPVRAYHGTAGDLQGGMFSRDRAGNNFPNEVSKFGVSFDTNPDVAAKYAEGAGIMPAYWKHLDETRRAPSREMIDELGQQSPAAIYPVDIYGRGADLSQGFHDLGATQMAAELQRLKDQGYDYARFPSERGQGHHEINVWNPGTVRSALTGETLFANGLPSRWGAAVQGQQTPPYQNSLFTY